ncbi:2-succinyl-6-hydroxy-2,4-cyclohexadiene-1-carboxylate synthase, partial [Fischerella thermalis CCMEE 5196]
EKFIDINQQMAKICQYCQLKIVSNAGHNIHFENPNAFVENLKKFLISNQPFREKSHNQA